jgi:hypothetical protein
VLGGLPALAHVCEPAVSPYMLALGSPCDKMCVYNISYITCMLFVEIVCYLLCLWLEDIRFYEFCHQCCSCCYSFLCLCHILLFY